MCLVCCTRPIASIALFTQGFRAFRMSARAEKGCGVADLVPSPATPQPFSAYRAAILHYPTAFRSIAHEAIVLGQKAVSESLPHVGSHGGKPPPTWERHSGLLSPNGG